MIKNNLLPEGIKFCVVSTQVEILQKKKKKKKDQCVSNAGSRMVQNNLLPEETKIKHP